MNKTLIGSTLLAAALGGCLTEEPNLGTTAGESYETWKAGLGREPGTGKYVLDWDIATNDEAKLFSYWESIQQGTLAIYSINGADIKWNDTQKLNLTYCIGSTFGANTQKVVDAMAAASDGGWEKFANVNYIHVTAQDGAGCTATNTNVVMDVNQVNSGGQYLARSFFPNDARADRNVLIDPASFDPAQTGNIPLSNILTHELGHTLGFRHEHIRSDQGRTVQCPEDNQYRGVTPYDVVSTMHYPQCGSPGNTLALSAKDQSGVAMIYGAPGANTAPVANVTQPANGATVGPTFDVEAQVVDTNLQKVELFLDGTLYGTAKTAPPFVFTVMNAPTGGHALKIHATDGAGLTTDTQINVTVSASGGSGGTGTGGGNNGGGGEQSDDVTGGCNTGGSSSLLLGLGLLGLAIRRRR